MANISVTPVDLKFRFELKKQIPVTLTIHNHGDLPAAFKVKTTSPKKYIVRPSAGLIRAKGVFDVQVIMQPQKDPPIDLKNCKDKFLVQAVALNEILDDVPQDLFENTNASDIKEIKMKVILMAPPGPPSPVPEIDEREEACLTTTDSSIGHQSDFPVATRQKKLQDYDVIREKLQQSQIDNEALRHELDMLSCQFHGRDVVYADRTASSQFSGFTFSHLFLTAILCFLMGHFT